VATIVIPDIHQNIEFPSKILKKHFDGNSSIVFLGDYFDSFNKDLSLVETCDFLKGIIKDNLPVTFLIGNHDISYYEAVSMMIASNKPYINKKLKYSCSGYSNNKSKKIRKNLDIQFFKDLKLYVEVDGFLLSHAGFCPYHFKPYVSMKDNLLLWEQEMNNLHEYISSPIFNRLGEIGKNRGGEFEFGSPIWLDFLNEFKVVDGISQIVGHTGRNKSIKEMIKGNNFCIDNNQTTYSIIEDGNITIYNNKGIIYERSK
jgi:hypothetical protein